MEQADNLNSPFSFDEIGQFKPTIWKWGKRFGFSILDQGFFSGANFLLSILLGRWLSPEEYGAYAVAFSIMLILAGIQSSLIYEPMMVFGPTKFQSLLPIYIRKLSLLQLGISISLSVIALIAGLLISSFTQKAILGMALAMPFILSMWFFRQCCYLDAKSKLASINSLMYFFMSLIGVYLLVNLKYLSLFTIFGLQAICSIISIIFLAPNLTKTCNLQINQVSYKEIIHFHWKYGRWILPASIANSLAALIIAPVLSLYRNLGEIGAFKAYQNLLTPITQLYVALNLFLLPRLSQIRDSLGDYRAKFVQTKMSWLYLMLTLIYIFIIHFYGSDIIFLLYKSSFYLTFRSNVVLIEIIIVLAMIASLLGTRARYMQKPKQILYAKIFGALVTLLTIRFFILKFELSGAFLVIIASYFIEISIYLLIPFIINVQGREIS